MRKQLSAAAVLATLAIGVLPAGTLADTTCPQGYACLWEFDDHQGRKLLQPGGVFGDTGWQNLFPGDRNIASSAKSHLTNRVVWYVTGLNGAGLVRCIAPNDPPVHQFGNGFNDNIESFRISAPGGHC